MKFVASAVSGVTIERALRRWISKQEIFQNILPDSALNIKDKEKIIKKALRYVLQKRFVDYYATIQGCNCINRLTVQDNILAIRNKGVTYQKAMYEYAGFVYDAFCNGIDRE